MQLYVDCIPPRGAEPLAPYVQELCAGIAKFFGTADLRVAPDKDSLLAYGGWRGVLAAAVRDKPPAPGTYYIVRRSDIDEEVASALYDYWQAVAVQS